jgi:hypothetical protein
MEEIGNSEEKREEIGYLSLKWMTVLLHSEKQSQKLMGNRRLYKTGRAMRLGFLHP